MFFPRAALISKNVNSSAQWSGDFAKLSKSAPSETTTPQEPDPLSLREGYWSKQTCTDETDSAFISIKTGTN